MTQELPIHIAESWTFHLHMTSPVQLRITSKQDSSAQLVIEGHDISTLLDYLYEQREHIYEATHDQETRRLEASQRPPTPGRARRRVRPIRYFYDGEVRTSAEQDQLASNKRECS